MVAGWGIAGHGYDGPVAVVGVCARLRVASSVTMMRASSKYGRSASKTCRAVAMPPKTWRSDSAGTSRLRRVPPCTEAMRGTREVTSGMSCAVAGDGGLDCLLLLVGAGQLAQAVLHGLVARQARQPPGGGPDERVGHFVLTPVHSSVRGHGVWGNFGRGAGGERGRGWG